MEIHNSIQQPPLQGTLLPASNRSTIGNTSSAKGNDAEGSTTDRVSISPEARKKNVQDQADVNNAQETQAPTGEGLTQEELTKLNELKARDAEVRAHEQAHLAAAGGHATGGASYTLQKGPDGKSYAVGGEVGIDLSKENDPNATILKMQTVKRAALAPASPSSTDRQVAAQASVKEAQARQELQQEQQEALLAAEESGTRPQAISQANSSTQAEGVTVSALKASIAIYEQMSAM